MIFGVFGVLFWVVGIFLMTLYGLGKIRTVLDFNRKTKLIYLTVLVFGSFLMAFVITWGFIYI